MILSTKALIQAFDYGDRLQFAIIYDREWLQTVIGALVLVFALREFWFGRTWWWIAFAVLDVMGIIADRARGNEVELNVTPREITASGNLGKLFSTRVSARTQELTRIGYEIGAKGDQYGLFGIAYCKRICFVPNLSEEQCREITDAIYRKFPELPVGDRGPHSPLSSAADDPILLGIYRPK